VRGCPPPNGGNYVRRKPNDASEASQLRSGGSAPQRRDTVRGVSAPQRRELRSAFAERCERSVATTFDWFGYLGEGSRGGDVFKEV
jgi:hypothetical protein